MSSIQNLKSSYEQLRIQPINNPYSKSVNGTSAIESLKNYLPTDTLNISEEGLAALEALETERKEDGPPMDRPMGKPPGQPPMGPPPVQAGTETESASTSSLLDEESLNALLDSLKTSSLFSGEVATEDSPLL